MKLKGLGNRAYNVLFHTHTVTGIVISFALFVIFYAGAFSLFRHEIYKWENPAARIDVPAGFDYDRAFRAVDEVFHLDPHAITHIVFPNRHDPFFKVYGATHDTDSTVKRIRAAVHPATYAVTDLSEPPTTVGDTIYHLHYFGQIPVAGLYISGFVALFFLFATITGVLIHWRNLITKFYAFIIKGKWKQIWTNAHTVLGILGLPFQVVYAVTGAFFGLLTLLLLPSVLVLFDGDRSQVFEKARPWMAIELDGNTASSDNISMEELIDHVRQQYPHYQVIRAIVRNYGKTNALLTVNIDDQTGILASGNITMKMKDGTVIPEASILPDTKTYSHAALELIAKLHFANFGGIFLKGIYFILALITAFVIISGILIWRTARDNGKYTLKQRLFHHRVTKVYLAICLSLFPAFAIIFLSNKLVPIDLNGRVAIVNQIFFISWLALTVTGLFLNSYSRQNRNYLLIGGFLSLLVPVVNGIVTGDWFWQVWRTLPQVAYVDIFWLATGVFALVIVFKVLKISKIKDIPTEEKSLALPVREKTVTPVFQPEVFEKP